jgi:hypothetical protein
VTGGVLLGRVGAGHDIGLQLDLRAVGPAEPDLDETGGVGEQQLDAAVGLGPPVAGLLRERAHLVAVVVEQPAAAEVVDERLARQLGEGDLLSEPELVDGRVAAHADATPGAEQPGDRDDLRRHVRADLHRHRSCGSVPAQRR